jgi:hypothetical protein
MNYIRASQITKKLLQQQIMCLNNKVQEIPDGQNVTCYKICQNELAYTYPQHTMVSSYPGIHEMHPKLQVPL